MTETHRITQMKYKQAFTWHDVFCLFLVYLLSQGLMLLLHGTWWDDWEYVFRDKDVLNTVSLQSGRISYAIFIKMVWWLPRNGYLFIVFLLYFTDTLLIYGTLRRIDLFSCEDAFWIAALYIVMPMNDARVMLANIPYCFALVSFWLSFFLFEYWGMYQREKNGVCLLYRGLTLLLFIIAFTMNSILFFYSLFLLYLVYRNKSIVRVLCGYFDFIVLPVAFWLLKGRFFPTYGAYREYNQVTIQSCFNAVRLLPHMVWDCLKNTWMNRLPPNHCFLLVIIYIIVTLVWFIFKNKKENQSDAPLRNRLFYLSMAVFAIIVVAVGLFPYIVIRGNRQIMLSGVSGRDSILVPFGMALLVYYIVMLILGNNPIRKLLYTLVLSLGTVYFTTWYYEYQKDYYIQCGFRVAVEQSNEIRNGVNFIVYNRNASDIGGDRFYTWSGNAAMAFGEKTRLFVNGENEIYLFDNDSFRNNLCILYTPLKEYNIDSKKVDGKIYLDNSFSKSDILRLRWLELVDPKKFEEVLMSDITFEYIANNV